MTPEQRQDMRRAVAAAAFGASYADSDMATLAIRRAKRALADFDNLNTDPDGRLLLDRGRVKGAQKWTSLTD